MKELKIFLNNSIFRHIINNHVNKFKLDHIAYRSFDNKNIINKYISKNYIIQKDLFNFPKHNATAIWLKNDKENVPRIFLSQYNSIYKDRNLINSNIDIDIIQYYILNNKPINYQLYLDIYNLNQYLAWTLVFRDNMINHVAIEVKNIDKLFSKLKNDELVKLSGNLQISSDKKLIQFSTKSENNLVHFSDGNYSIPTFFFEFVERFNNREGFSEKNANIIFDSTKI